MKTERLQLRRIDSRDWRDIREIWVDFAASPFAQYDVPHDTSEADVRPRIARWESTRESAEHMFFAVCREEGLIGYIDCHKLGEGYEIGYCFHSASHGKGYAKESLSALVGYLRTLGARRIYAGTALNNTPSVALLRSLGFRQTALEQVSFYKDRNGQDIFFDGGRFELAL